jgi:phytoene desaturase
VKDPRLQTMLSFHPLLIGGNPFSVTAVYALISYLEQRHGVFSAMGGTGAIVEGDGEPDSESQGSTLRFNSQVEEILVEDGRATGVRLVSGEVLPAAVVVSNADAAWTYRHLLPAEARKHWTDRKIERSRFPRGCSCGTSVPTAVPDVPQHSFFSGRATSGLLDDIFRSPAPGGRLQSLPAPSHGARSDSLAPAGCDTFYVLAPVPHLDSGTDWEAQAEPYRRLSSSGWRKRCCPDSGCTWCRPV